MKAITALALGALLATAAACSDNDPNDQQSWAPTFLMPQCSPVDTQCQLADPPHLDERPGPGTQ
jgi:hypothetical protein